MSQVVVTEDALKDRRAKSLEGETTGRVLPAAQLLLISQTGYYPDSA